MAKTYTKEDLIDAKDKATEVATVKVTKVVTRTAIQQVNAEIARVKASDLSKPEQKAAITALKNAAASIKSPEAAG